MKRPFRCPIFVTAAVVGVSAVAIAIYYFWRQRTDEEKKKKDVAVEPSATPSASSTTSSGPADGAERAGGGKEPVDGSTDMFTFPDMHVRKVCERLFLEQMDLGEEYMSSEETVERGAMHLANAITLTGETEPLLKVLRKAVSPANFARIQKYIPTAELRVQQMLQDELTVESINEHFS